MVLLDPEEIERRSFSIIEEELRKMNLNFSPYEFEIVKRVVHTTADFEYAKNIYFSPSAVEEGIRKINMKEIVVDVEMVRAGISRKEGVRCYISNEDVIKRAKELGITRAAFSMRKAVEEFPDAIFAIGNSPTALFELIKLMEEGKAKPSLIIGVPVGFVSAAEVKEELKRKSKYPFITIEGRKGGSTVAVAIINALLRLAKK